MIEKLIEYCVSNLVSKPEVVSVSKKEDGTRFIEVKVSSQDVAKVIGKDGRTLKALRMLIGTVDPQSKDLLIEVIGQ